MRLDTGTTAPAAVEAAGPASDLALFLRRRIPAAALHVTGDTGLLPHWFTLVPPVRRARPGTGVGCGAPGP
ncbi:hypothetical protein ACFQ7B_02110 [Streptomyces erythrochromogenes]|uniref:hypothetical protein n=1 Tax=Streptomyces erythrochromogenes TaxID=285574 RepID=UPI0036761AF3